MEWITEYVHLLHDPAHWAFELTVQLLVDGLLIGVGWKAAMRWVKRHDRKHHADYVDLVPEADVCPCGEDDPELHHLAHEAYESKLRKEQALDKMDPIARMKLAARKIQEEETDGIR